MTGSYAKVAVPQQPTEGRRFRDVMGRYATGVVLLTSDTPNGSTGLAVNSFTSLSLDPPLVVFGVAETSSSWPAIRDAGAFAANILRADHLDLCRTFAKKGADRFAGRSWDTSPSGHPLVPDALGWLECTIETIHPGGDHDLVVARAHRWSADSGAPLIFYQGKFADLADTEA
ncbi:MAG: flavin reductase family protein [Rhodococcus sp. (in: high G+C Gram-positive bacteria)]|uniref:flavin reductase family protein n=1 Tax=Rhodococcus sp. TaxID=1831 RepID=UPI002ADA5D3E|nr:flavin reductase family protein [Rhodococcus sp. (in: high G+C Gram-positive bacteria)]